MRTASPTLRHFSLDASNVDALLLLDDGLRSSRPLKHDRVER
jgi:hypothetical protein